MKKLADSMHVLSKILTLHLLLGCFASVSAQEESLEGQWKYLSIKSSDGELEVELEISEGDGIVFTKDTIFWRWQGTDHVNKYKVETSGSHSGFVGFDEDGIPMIKGIFKFEGGRLIVCDRPAARGFPAEFSSEEGILIVLEREKELPDRED